MSKKRKKNVKSKSALGPTSKKGRQRPEPKSPTPSTETLNSGDSWDSSDSSSQSSQSSYKHSPTTQPMDIETQIPKIPLPPPIIIPTSLWRTAAPLIFQNNEISSTGLIAKSMTDGNINLKTTNVIQFRQIQKTLLANNVAFHTHTLASDRQLKVVLKGVPTNVSTDELKTELEARNFEVQLIRRFGTAEKLMPICLVTLSGTNAKDIYELSDIFFLKIVVESYKKTGPSQCHTCQRFGHGSQNCGNTPRCVKCAGTHRTSDCTKTRDQEPTCINCNGSHTANYRGCPSYVQVASIFTKNQPNSKKISSVQPISSPNQTTQQPSSLTQTPSTRNLPTHDLNYAQATKTKPAINTETVIKLLSELLSAISTSEDPKAIISATIKSFITLLTSNIILISETKLKPTSKLHLPNFHTHRTDLPSVRGSPAHGGTAVLVNRRIVHHHTSLRTDLQSTSVIIKLQDTEILITAVYKPPNQILVPIDLDTLTQTSDWSISAGDLNSKHPLWHSRTTNTAGSTLYNHVQRSDYAVMAPSTPTYHPYNNSFRPDVLDIALIKIPMSIEITNINDLSSDHNPILLEVHSTPIASYPPSAKRFINWRKYADLLAKQVTDMNPCTTALYDIDQAIEKFSTTIHTAIGQNSSALKPRRATMVLPSFIIDEIQAKNRLRRDWQTSRDPETKRRLNAKQHFIRAVLSTHKKDKWDKFLDSLDTQDGSIYKINKTLLHKRPATHPLSGPNGLVFSATDKAELIADSLAQQFTLNPGPELPEVTNFIRRFTNAAPSSTLHTSPGFVADILSKLPKNRAPGEDLITNTALRLLPRNMILALTKILNGCLRLCYFPTAWKRATIISIPKPGKDPLRPDSCRPIALLSSISKIYEKIILLRLQKHISDQIRPEQSAFRSEHSTAQQLVKLVDRISNNLNNRIQTASVFLDVEKAFDRVWHDGLLYKMSTLKIPQNLIKLTQSFLSNRSFRVRIEDKLSSLRDIQAGVPQGSCLAPTLYLIFTNDIPVNNKASVALFADDTMYLTSNHNANIAIIQLQRQLQQTSVWFKKWRLRINAYKTITILFSRKRTNNLPQISINDTLIPWSTHVMYLGVTFGRTLNFGMHIKNTVRKATRTRGILYPILNRNSPVPTRARINIFKLYINPIMTYAGAAWAPFISTSQWKTLEAVQTIGARTILGIPFYVRNQTTLSTADLKQIKVCIRAQASALFHKNSFSRYRHIRELGREEITNPHYSSNKVKPRPISWALKF
ncbi:hypothetical protein QTP88_027041 [Uroleucon formosanum]